MALKIGFFQTTKEEIEELLKAWVMISIAFGIVLTGGAIFSEQFPINTLIAAITVGIGFLLHELAHKVVAQKYNCFAEFKSNMTMLLLAVMMSFFGFIIAAPGAVWITGQVTKKENGKIAVAGPVTNIIVALLFALLLLVPGLEIVAYYGFMINSWLALFNMIPAGMFDGAKVIKWNPYAYTAVTAIAAVMTFTSFFMQTVM